MNWEAIGAVCELLGAIGVIITLIYLAVQVRQNTEQMRDATTDARLTAFDRSVESFARHREYLTREGNSELLAKGLDSYAPLTEAEKYRFCAIIEEYFFAFHALLGRVTEGRYEESLWLAQARRPAQLLKTRGGKEWWEERKYGFTPRFVQTIEEIASES